MTEVRGADWQARVDYRSAALALVRAVKALPLRPTLEEKETLRRVCERFSGAHRALAKTNETDAWAGLAQSYAEKLRWYLNINTAFRLCVDDEKRVDDEKLKQLRFLLDETGYEVLQFYAEDRLLVPPALSDDLLPCPFCGGQAERAQLQYRDGQNRHSIACGECGATLMPAGTDARAGFASELDAERAWQSRWAAS